MKFHSDRTENVMGSALVYQENDFAFNVVPKPKGIKGSLSIDTLELCVDLETMKIVYVYGYCPHLAWKKEALNVPKFEVGSLYVSEIKLVPGVSAPIQLNGGWKKYVDPQSGWVCIGNVETRGHAIRFSSDCLAVVDNGNLTALWLHPSNLPRELCAQPRHLERN